MGAPTAHSVVMQHSRRQAAPHAAPAVSAAAAAAAAAEEATAAAEAAEARRKMGRVRRAGLAAVELLDSTGVQLVLYVVFVLMFQLLAGAVRMPQEFYLDKHVMDRLVESHFDASHNRFATIRRVADVYEWGNVVLLPGLFADLGPCREEVGAEGGKACNDDTWPDGEGSFHLDGATPLGIEELVKRMDQFDWTDGLYLRQGRVGATEGCPVPQLGACYPELQRGSASREPFGYNWTHPSSPPRHPFEFFTQEQLGSNPSGLLSAAIPSLRDYDSDGFVALAIPFFSEVYLPHQEGTAEQVTDYRLYAVTPSNNRQARYYCVRVSHNGRHLKQLCDPGADGNGHQPYTGAVRATVEQWWNDLKRAHFLDAQSRVLTITLQLRSNNMGVGYRILLMLEFTSLGAILPSFNVETRLLDPEHEDRIIVYSGVALALVLLFSVNEIVEIVQNGIFNYFSDLWNVADWTNYFFFYVLYGQIMYTVGSASERDCSSYLCTSIGYYDDYKIMGAYRTTKLLLSICICIQLFKILKLFALLVPRMGLATAVLRKCVVDLLFFGVTFVISMLAFSNMLYIQLGPVMENYWDQLTAFMSLFRALFGDFDVEKIMDNSSGWFNTIVFLGYLFVAIFIMLSMFLAILAEAQVDVREDEKSIEEATNGAYKQYGIFEDIGELMSKHVIQPIRAQLIGEQAAAASAPAAEPEKSEKPPASANEQLFDAVRRLQETTQALQWSVEQSREQNRQLQAEVAALRYQSPAPKFSPAHLVTPPPPPSAGSPLGSLDVRRVRAANTLRVEGEPEDEEPVQSSVHFTYTV